MTTPLSSPKMIVAQVYGLTSALDRDARDQQILDVADAGFYHHVPALNPIDWTA